MHLSTFSLMDTWVELGFESGEKKGLTDVAVLSCRQPGHFDFAKRLSPFFSRYATTFFGAFFQMESYTDGRVAWTSL